MDEIYECPKCSGKMILPSDISEQVRAEITEACRKPSKIDAIVFIRRKLDVGLGEGKFMVNHISKSDGTCGRCGNKLPESGITYCPGCNSLNLNW